MLNTNADPSTLPTDGPSKFGRNNHLPVLPPESADVCMYVRLADPPHVRYTSTPCKLDQPTTSASYTSYIVLRSMLIHILVRLLLFPAVSILVFRLNPSCLAKTAANCTYTLSLAHGRTLDV